MCRTRAGNKVIRLGLIAAVFLGLPTGVAADDPDPIIDVHLHSLPADSQGPPPVAICAPYPFWPARDAKVPASEWVMDFFKNPPCRDPLWSAKDDNDLMNRTLAIMKRRNVIGVTSGPPEFVARWKSAAPDRIIPGILMNTVTGPTASQLAEMIDKGELAVIGELTDQYLGRTPDHPGFEPFFRLAEEKDVPLGIHIGPGPPGVAYFGNATSEYRGRFHSALSLEEPLRKFPKARVYVMHAGWPKADDMVALMYAHPQVYVGVGIISYAMPRAGFYSYLKRLVDEGFGKRIMFGSDQMVWPDALERAIKSIEDAPFLSKDQKRDILYNNAARFLRLNKES